MTRTEQSRSIPNLWDDAYAAKLDEPGLLLYRSNLLGSDLRITNFGGGNTSAKAEMIDPLTRKKTDVLWVKGSGGDLGSMRLDGFASLYMDKFLALKNLYRGLAQEDEMVELFSHCAFNLNPRAASIDTPLHGFVPHKHVDHMHADAVIAIAASADVERLTKEIYGGEMGFLPWQRPGFDLGLKLGAMAGGNPKLNGVVLGGHGLFTWGATAKESYLTTLRIIQRAADWLDQNARNPSFQGARFESAPDATRSGIAKQLMPLIRGKISKDERKIGHFTDAPEVLEFVNSKVLDALAPLGTSCPDHFLRTKIRPLVLPFDPATGRVENLTAELDDQLAVYRKDYQGYYDRCKFADSPAIRDPNPVIFLIPGIGMLSFAKDKATARIASEFYINAINVMRGASGVSSYVGLPEKEAFGIEYWLLEEAKLQRMPKPKALAGRVAFITGGAGGIGSATAAQLLSDGACVVLADIDEAALAERVEGFAKQFGKDNVRGLKVDVTSETSVTSGFSEAVQMFGGLDIVVSNAGIASAASVEDTTLALWQKNMDIMSTGYFLVAREAFRLMQKQATGGAIIFVASKNGLAASAGASAYCAAKASEIHLARCLALEGAPHGIRVNTVNPDAVLQGSKIWQGEWRDQRAASYKVEPGGLEEIYRQRSMLKLSVLPADIAEAIAFFASDRSAKSTGNILNVDAGNAQAFTR